VAEGTRGGRGRCRACNSPDQDAINNALRLGRPSLRILEKRYGISKTSLAEHKTNHLSPALITLTSSERRPDGSTRGPVREQLEDLVDHTAAILLAARKSRNMQQALGAIGRATTLLELLAKISGELDERPQVTVNIQQTQEWIQLREVIFEVIHPYPEVERRLIHRLKVLEGKS